MKFAKLCNQCKGSDGEFAITTFALGAKLCKVHICNIFAQGKFHANSFFLPVSSTSPAVINKTKAHFARCGSPNDLVSDNDPQYVSESFERFAKVWDFEHRTISPRHSKSNGKVESAVKTAKRLLRKSVSAKTN